MTSRLNLEILCCYNPSKLAFKGFEMYVDGTKLSPPSSISHLGIQRRACQPLNLIALEGRQEL